MITPYLAGSGAGRLRDRPSMAGGQAGEVCGRLRHHLCSRSGPFLLLRELTEGSPSSVKVPLSSDGVTAPCGVVESPLSGLAVGPELVRDAPGDSRRRGRHPAALPPR